MVNLLLLTASSKQFIVDDGNREILHFPKTFGKTLIYLKYIKVYQASSGCFDILRSWFRGIKVALQKIYVGLVVMTWKAQYLFSKNSIGMLFVDCYWQATEASLCHWFLSVYMLNSVLTLTLLLFYCVLIWKPSWLLRGNTVYREPFEIYMND